MPSVASWENVSKDANELRNGMLTEFKSFSFFQNLSSELAIFFLKDRTHSNIPHRSLYTDMLVHQDLEEIRGMAACVRASLKQPYCRESVDEERRESCQIFKHLWFC